MALLQGRRVAILAENRYEEMELWYPLLRLKEEGAEVVVIGTKQAKYEGKYGYPLKADKGIDEVKAEDFDGVIIPGGYAPDIMRRSDAMVEFVRKANELGKAIGAICHGPWMLASADIVRGRKITCFFSIKVDLVNAGGIYEDSPVVVDGNLITSRTPQDLPDFARAYIEMLSK